MPADAVPFSDQDGLLVPPGGGDPPRCRLFGFSAKAVNGDVTINLRAGDVTGTVLVALTMVDGESVRDVVGTDGVWCEGGLYQENVAGSEFVVGSVWVST